MSKSFCFIIDDSILTTHHGVRRYIFSIAESLKVYNYKVEFLKKNKDKWDSIVFNDNYFINNGFQSDIKFADSRSEILSKLKNAKLNKYFDGISTESVNYETRSFSSDFLYDICILCAPWVYKSQNLPKSKKTYCIAYDVIPNRYYFAKPSDEGLKSFAAEHSNGYTWADDVADGILCISDETKRQCEIFGFGQKKGLKVIPTILPNGFEKQKINCDDDSICKTVILAAPFDERKGLKLIPDLVNSGDFTKLIIFGRPRCDLKLVQDFYEKIDLNEIEWWFDICTEKQIELYSRSQLLIFPSISEGLGLPILEAYACGVSTLVSDTQPLNRLVFEGDLLDKELVKARQQVRQRSNERIDKIKFSTHAKKRWGSNNLIKWVEDYDI
ncbi:glycosyltransferase [Endozoicomonas gorgoniicola]|uniref:Glycosyltransferase n=1 Tax=Endozoicomonas gorgoniicola TaxID=1234144 RepID=A0ABT3MT65_9GAMM|nr:glycosyltransferase [Endozoicomonas gorgoniicola]MCW7552194.1 glycosyltransferase [Endozoicomonas gorgoniicola]